MRLGLLTAVAAVVLPLVQPVSAGGGGAIEVRVAVVLPADRRFSASLSKVMPVLDIAVRDLYRTGVLSRRTVTFQFVQNDDKCEDIEALRSAFDMIKTCSRDHLPAVDLFMGPTCDYGVDLVARMIKFWNVPLLTTGGLTNDFTEDKRDPKSKYYLLVRAGTLAFQHMANVVVSVLDRYAWKRVLILYEINGYLKVGKQTCGLMVRTLADTFKAGGVVQYDAFDLSKNPQYNLTQNLGIEAGSKYTGKSISSPLV